MRNFYVIKVVEGVRHKSDEYRRAALKEFPTEEAAEAAATKLRQLYGNIFDVCEAAYV
jgi:hypothetical protein